MVQYFDGFGQRLYKSYWKISCSFCSETIEQLKRRLKRKRYYHKSSANKERLVDLLCRADRGLLSYDKCSVQELRTFCAQRKLRPIEDTKKKRELVEFLEQADEDSTFDRFLDLPAELRNAVYEIHFETFEPLRNPYPPPLTWVSRQLRQESLLLFYQTCTVWAIGCHFVDEQEKPYERPVVPSNLRTLVTSSPKHCLENARRFVIKANVVYQFWPYEAATWTVDLGLEGEKIKIHRDLEGCWAHHKAICEELEAQITEGFTQTGSRMGAKRLNRDDLPLLERMFKSKHFIWT